MLCRPARCNRNMANDKLSWPFNMLKSWSDFSIAILISIVDYAWRKLQLCAIADKFLLT